TAASRRPGVRSPVSFGHLIFFSSAASFLLLSSGPAVAGPVDLLRITINPGPHGAAASNRHSPRKTSPFAPASVALHEGNSPCPISLRDYGKTSATFAQQGDADADGSVGFS